MIEKCEKLAIHYNIKHKENLFEQDPVTDRQTRTLLPPSAREKVPWKPFEISANRVAGHCA
jgi:hypothetical protein